MPLLDQFYWPTSSSGSFSLAGEARASQLLHEALVDCCMFLKYSKEDRLAQIPSHIYYYCYSSETGTALSAVGGLQPLVPTKTVTAADLKLPNARYSACRSLLPLLCRVSLPWTSTPSWLTVGTVMTRNIQTSLSWPVERRGWPLRLLQIASRRSTRGCRLLARYWGSWWPSAPHVYSIVCNIV